MQRHMKAGLMIEGIGRYTHFQGAVGSHLQKIIIIQYATNALHSIP
jgi:hypothetical protein